MSHQLTFADSEFNNKRRKTRKEIFLSRMDKLIAAAYKKESAKQSTSSQKNTRE